MTCKDCSYDDRGRLDVLCGPCEERAIQERIRWWQDGKRSLREREKFSQALRAKLGTLDDSPAHFYLW